MWSGFPRPISPTCLSPRRVFGNASLSPAARQLWHSLFVIFPRWNISVFPQNICLGHILASSLHPSIWATIRPGHRTSNSIPYLCISSIHSCRFSVSALLIPSLSLSSSSISHSFLALTLIPLAQVYPMSPLEWTHHMCSLCCLGVYVKVMGPEKIFFSPHNKLKLRDDIWTEEPAQENFGSYWVMWWSATQLSHHSLHIRVWVCFSHISPMVNDKGEYLSWY